MDDISDPVPEQNNDADYWRRQAEAWQFKHEECRLEFDEFTSSSRELEHELEKELEDFRRHNLSLKNDLRLAAEENRQVKEQEQRLIRRNEALEDQVKNYDTQKQSMNQYRRELEQKNDELETSYRNLTASLSDHAKRIEALIEEKALLENELENTRGQKEAEQRLRDELRDLRDEMAARNKADESQSRLIAQRERRRTMDQSEINSEREIMRLQSMSSGDFTSSIPTNGHDVGSHVDAHNHRACVERETELTAALAAHANSKTLIQNLVRKITSLESDMQGIRRGSLKTANGEHP